MHELREHIHQKCPVCHAAPGVSCLRSHNDELDRAEFEVRLAINHLRELEPAHIMVKCYDLVAALTRKIDHKR